MKQRAPPFSSAALTRNSLARPAFGTTGADPVRTQSVPARRAPMDAPTTGAVHRSPRVIGGSSRSRASRGTLRATASVAAS